MPTQIKPTDHKSIALNPLKHACAMFLRDLRALPEDAYRKTFGGKTRTIPDIVYEVNLVNDHVGMVIRGETPFEWPDGAWIYAPAGFSGKDAVIDAFEKSSQRIVSTVEAFTDEEIDAPLQTEEGETNRFERCRFMTLHLWYHAGQLNFIQSMYGDDVWHWAE